MRSNIQTIAINRKNCTESIFYSKLKRLYEYISESPEIMD